MACDIGHALLEVLHVGACFEASNVAAHKHPAELWAWCRGVPFRVASDVERVVLLAVEKSGAKAAVDDAAAHAEVHQVSWVGGGLAVGHAIQLLWWGLHAAHEEVVNISTHDSLLFGRQDVLLLHDVASEVGQLGGVGNPHGHALDLPAHLATVDRVGGGQAEAQHFFQLGPGPATTEHPPCFADVRCLCTCGTMAGRLLLRFLERKHDVLHYCGLVESGVHCREVVSGHPVCLKMGGVHTNVAGEVVDTLNRPEATEAGVTLAPLVLCLER